jgi:hypothetical protein
VQVKENVRQSASLEQGLFPQNSSAQAAPGGTQVPQLALQHSRPAAQKAGPQRVPYGAVD